MWGTGCNTDGQLGLGPSVLDDVHEFTRLELPSEVQAQGGVVELRAGADTSALITATGTVWTWGNSVSQPPTPPAVNFANYDCE